MVGANLRAQGRCRKATEGLETRGGGKVKDVAALWEDVDDIYHENRLVVCSGRLFV